MESWKVGFGSEVVEDDVNHVNWYESGHVNWSAKMEEARAAGLVG